MDQNTLDELPSIADVVHGVKSVVDFQKAWKFLVWIILVYIAEYAGNHGLVFVIVSGIAAVFLNLSNENSTGISAYSVFNRNAQRMLGSLTAEQFENEIRHRQPGANQAVPVLSLEEQEEQDLRMAMAASMHES